MSEHNRAAYLAVIRKTCIAALLAGSLSCAGAAAQQIPGLNYQEGSTWCWAAASQIVMNGVKLSNDVYPNDQPTQAERVIFGCTSAPRDTCGAKNPVYAGCNRPGFPTFNEYGFKYQEKDIALPWEQLEPELAIRPVLFGWCVEGRCGGTTSTSMGHWMVAVGTSICPTTDSKSVGMVKVYNPAPCCVGQFLNVPYETYANAAAGLKFWRNYYQVQPPNAVAPPALGPPVIAIPERSFPPGNTDATSTAATTATTCLPIKDKWDKSGLLRGASSPDQPADVKATDPTHRRYVPLAALGALTSKEGMAALHAIMPSTGHTVVPLIGKDTKGLTSVILEKLPSGNFRALGFEDSLAADRLIERRALALTFDPDPITGPTRDDYVVLETGLHFMLVKSKTGPEQEAIVILSEINCRKPAGEKATNIPFSELIEMLTVSR